MNLNIYMNKLIKALQLRGERYVINQLGVWSEEYNRSIVKYELMRYCTQEEYEQEGLKVRKNQKSFKLKIWDGYSKAELVKILAQIYKDGKEGEQ